MRRCVYYGIAVGLLLVARVSFAVEIAAIAYHDVVLKSNADPYAITLKEFERQMDYLVREGYRPISLKMLDDARHGRGTLPPKPVLLTFDDGLKSYYENAFPVLKKHGFPSVVSIVTSWIDGRTAPEEVYTKFMTWDQLRELSRSSLVEVLSHTDDLHRTAPMNSWGARLWSAITRTYDAASGTYEAEEAHLRRVSADLARSAERIRAELGRAPIGVTWPYGKYDQVLINAAASLGMRYHLTLDSDPTQLAGLPRINRGIFRDYRALSDFENALTYRGYRKHQMRFVEVELAPFAGKDRNQQERLLTQLVNRLDLLHVDTVILHPFTADGRRAFFHNGDVPVEVDILNQINYQILARTEVQQILLRLPGTKDAGSYRDLARLNTFHGILLEGQPSPQDIERARTSFGYYRPMIRVGVKSGEAAQAADFAVVELAADASEGALGKQAAAALKEHRRTLFLLRRTPKTSDSSLRSAMQALRSTGAAHYGYGIDDFENSIPSALRIVKALTDHTVTAGDR